MTEPPLEEFESRVFAKVAADLYPTEPDRAKEAAEMMRSQAALLRLGFPTVPVRQAEKEIDASILRDEVAKNSRML